MGSILFCKNNYDDYNDFIITDFVRLKEFEKLQKEVQELKKQNNQNKKKRWKNYGNKK